MLDYVFFDQRPCRRFIEFLTQRGVRYEFEDVDSAFDVETLEVRVPEDLDSDLAQAIEDEYEQLMSWGQELAEQAGGEAAGDYQAAGVVVNLKDGRRRSRPRSSGGWWTPSWTRWKTRTSAASASVCGTRTESPQKTG